MNGIRKALRGSKAAAPPPQDGQGKMKLYEQGKLPHDKLPALAKRFLARKMRALKKAE